MSTVRINGTSTERVNGFAVWSVEVLNSDDEWVMVTSCYGPASATSAIQIADAWAKEEELPSLSRMREYNEGLGL